MSRKQSDQAQPTPPKQAAQRYDATMKSLVEQQAPQIVPYLIPGAIYEGTLDIEIIRPTMRADRVHRISYHDQPHLLHLEFQTSEDPKLQKRLLVYYAVLYQDHELPIISQVIYPFQTTIAHPPLRIVSQGEELLRLNYRILLLYEEDATTYLEQHAVSMYPFLPTMKQVTAELIGQAAQEMKEVYQDQDERFKDQIAGMKVFLDGNKTLATEEKGQIEEVIIMIGLDKIWEESALAKQMFAKGETRGRLEGETRGRLEGEARGELKATRTSVLTIVKKRFPGLVEHARQYVETLSEPEELNLLLGQLIVAPDEHSARSLLHSPSA